MYLIVATPKNQQRPVVLADPIPNHSGYQMVQELRRIKDEGQYHLFHEVSVLFVGMAYGPSEISALDWLVTCSPLSNEELEEFADHFPPEDTTG